MNQRRCPDCAVTMAETTVRTGNGYGLRIDGGKRDGVLGKLGLESTTKLEAVCCPECGLVRLYADGDVEHET
ncbi:hypothetical protein [Natronosalvus caseinilyticus]|uniref:hypothetical protein n=1 Tax=Natronosalvus caseinilyticus TaxID=2953747 RepID=UPI0028B21BF8|nr:hypothetical protein [Natronosalvus caseinilyticus]